MEKYINPFLIFVLSFLMPSCNEKRGSINQTSVIIDSSNYNIDGDNIQLFKPHVFDSLLYQSITKGNIDAYNKIYRPYFMKSRDRELLYYSMIMANKYNFPEPNFYVFYSLTYPYNDSILIKNVDAQTKQMAFYYLLKSYELGYDDAKYTIKKFFGVNKKFPKSSDFLEFK